LLRLAIRERAIAGRQIAAAKSSDTPVFIETVEQVSANGMKLQKVAIESGLSASSPCTATF
jgi:hypothetical protein